MNITIEYTRDKAQDSLKRLASGFRPRTTPEETLATFPWKGFIQGRPTQSELLRINQDFDPRGCFGRVALCFAIIEHFFPDQFQRYVYGEVTKDWFWTTLMNQWNCFYSKSQVLLPESWVIELLMYEEPHGIVVGENEYQFEPLSMLVEDRKVLHPGVRKYSPWSALTSALVVSQAIGEEDPHVKLRLLADADRICPNTCIVKQNKVLPLVMLNRSEEAKDILHDLILMRPTARLFFVLETLFGEIHEACHKMYGRRLWEVIKQQLEKETKQ